MRKIQTELTEKKGSFFPAQKMQISVFIFLIQSPVVVVVINSGAWVALLNHDSHSFPIEHCQKTHSEG